MNPKAIPSSSARATGPEDVRWWWPVILGACAGGTGWGIRGQYGHETGAMIAGLLISLTLTFLLCPTARSTHVVRAVAWGALAMGFGGSMTYGQTVGLTHDQELVGHGQALVWGLFGLAIKGGIWIGFAGAFLGMGLSGRRYGVGEVFMLMLALLGLSVLGIQWLNEPFDPSNKELPRLYFSDHWHWEPNAELKPRREVWGGLLLALLGFLSWCGGFRRDRLALRLGAWGMMGGALGFPAGQCLQAFHAWNPELFQTGWFSRMDPFMNWWNWMETTFGAIMGAALGLGLWRNRKRIGVFQQGSGPGSEVGEGALPGTGHHRFLSSSWEWLLLLVHLGLLIGVEFFSIPAVDWLYDFGLMLGFIPVVAVAAGRWWPSLVLLPVTLLPIAGKTVRELVYKQEAIDSWIGWIAYFILPVSLSVAGTFWLRRCIFWNVSYGKCIRPVWLFAIWIYFFLNFAFFRYPWPWEEWTRRTPNALCFFLFALCLTLAATCRLRSEEKQSRMR